MPALRAARPGSSARYSTTKSSVKPAISAGSAAAACGGGTCATAIVGAPAKALVASASAPIPASRAITRYAPCSACDSGCSEPEAQGRGDGAAIFEIARGRFLVIGIFARRLFGQVRSRHADFDAFGNVEIHTRRDIARRAVIDAVALQADAVEI